MDNVCSKGRDCLMLFCANPHAQYLNHKEKIINAVTHVLESQSYILGSEVDKFEKSFAEFRISEALMSIYRLIWDSYCSWYLEIAKPPYQKPIDKATYKATLGFMEKLMTVLHPFMPFLTEEVWHSIKVRLNEDCAALSQWPKCGELEANLLNDFSQASEVITELRTFRKKQNLAQKNAFNLSLIVTQTLICF